MKKATGYHNRKAKLFFLILILTIIPLSVFSYYQVRKYSLNQNKLTEFVQNKSNAPQQIATSTTYKLLFVGDIFLDRHIDELSQKSPLKYVYPFQGLNTLEKEKYDAWVGNLECPVTIEQSTKFQKSEWLKFSCKKEYLPELAKWFEIVSLANNHTDNMGGEKGLIETRKHLDDAGIKYFGHFDNSKSDDICKVIEIKKLSIAFCGFHGVYKLPTEKELEIIKKYSDKYITIVMPHQGEEYKSVAGTYQKKIYRKMIDNGADVVIGAHPHVIQNVENYKDKKIFYSLGNFIFDQSWSKTREHMVVEAEIVIDNFANNGTSTKPNFTIKYTPIFTNAGTDFITRKQNLTDSQYQAKLKSFGF